MGILNLRKKTTGKVVKTEPRNTISCRIETLDYSKAKRAIAHNMRLVKCKSVDESKKEKAWQVSETGFKKLGRNRKEVYSDFQNEYDKIENNNKSIINNPDNLDNITPSGRVKRWGHFKHDQILEGIIYIGADTNWGAEPGKAVLQAVKNINKWLIEVGSSEAFNVVYHADEKGKAHIHFMASASDSKTGKSLDIMRDGKALRLLQDRVVEEMEQYNFRRGARWDVEGSNRKKHLSIREYGEMQDSLKENLKLKAENVKLKDESEELKKVDAQLEGLTHHDINEILLNLNDKNKKHPKYKEYQEKIDKTMAYASAQTAIMEKNQNVAIADEHKRWLKSRMIAVKQINKVNKLNKSMDKNQSRKPD